MSGSANASSALITSDTYVGDLFTFLGSPAGRRDVTITVDNADAGEIIISTAWTAGSTFTFIAQNGGRFLGVGGAGATGGGDIGATGTAAGNGANGGHAILNLGSYAVSIDIDDGYLYGGGGGGGGGSYTDTGAGGDAGGGGGGGQGFNGASNEYGGLGGLGGVQIGVPPPSSGTDGSITMPGTGGIGGGVTIGTSDGGNGGAWGLGGRSGRSSNILSGIGNLAQFLYNGGIGGRSGDAYRGTTPATLIGASSEASLRSNDRMYGDFGPDYITLPFALTSALEATVLENSGHSFLTTGATLEINTTTTPVASTSYYLTGGTGVGANIEVRARGLTGDTDGTWTQTGAVDGTWVDIGTLRQWYKSSDNYSAVGALFEMRRTDLTSTVLTSYPDAVMASFFIKATTSLLI
jgi:hypothetical protein